MDSIKGHEAFSNQLLSEGNQDITEFSNVDIFKGHVFHFFAFDHEEYLFQDAFAEKFDKLIKTVLFVPFKLFDVNHGTKSGGVVHVNVQFMNGSWNGTVQMSERKKRKSAKCRSHT